MQQILQLTGVSVLMLGWAQISLAQTPPPRLTGAEATLKIVVLQGENAVNDIKSKTGTDPVVEVRDYREAVVPGAKVTFTLPYDGASGTFDGKVATYTARTNEQGQASASGLAPNGIPGRFSIKVVATDGSRTGSAVISQRNAAEATIGTRGNSLKWKIAGLVVGAGASVGTYAAFHRSGSPAPAAPAPIPNSLTIGAGTISISGPR